MANLQIKGIQDEFYQQIKALADSENRSVSQQVLYVLKGYLAREKSIKKTRTPAQVLLSLSGSWSDTRDAEEIIREIKASRVNSKKLSEGF
ncbi:MAG: hypothetical protein SWH68_07580 [Thermodesulfobacteriota bacterium]|nr:hypothetical protein [Thermodesulfobacteriota bacterium]